MVFDGVIGVGCRVVREAEQVNRAAPYFLSEIICASLRVDAGAPDVGAEQIPLAIQIGGDLVAVVDIMHGV